MARIQDKAYSLLEPTLYRNRNMDTPLISKGNWTDRQAELKTEFSFSQCINKPVNRIIMTLNEKKKKVNKLSREPLTMQQKWLPTVPNSWG